MSKLQRSRSQEAGSGPLPQEWVLLDVPDHSREKGGSQVPRRGLRACPTPLALAALPGSEAVGGGLPLPSAAVMEVGCWPGRPDCLGAFPWVGQALRVRPSPVGRLLGTGTHLVEEAQKPSQRVTVTLAVHPR